MSRITFNRIPISVKDGIPSFVEEESYSDPFGLQWQTWAKTQLDSHTGLTITQDRLHRMFGPLSASIGEARILEAGCGAGRFTEILLRKGADVTSFDLSSAVHVNLANNLGNKNLNVFRASITEIPIDPESFDIVFCPGVIQHTPNPNDSINSLWEQVKPGGWLVFDQYRHNLSTWLRTAWIFRIVLKRVSPTIGIKATNRLVAMLLPLHKKVANRKLLEILLFRISPITAHYSAYPTMTSEDQLAWAELNTHDNLTDYYKHLTTLSKLKSIITKLHPSDVQYTVMPYTIEVRMQKAITGYSVTTRESITKLNKRNNYSA
jgi:2-polyprenyl-3-methyl-5-hydroxy-6-metoxy-1,4-benzoquinol methylase